MVEARSLQIGPWLRPAEVSDVRLDSPASFVRRILDGNGLLLGFAAFRRAGEGLFSSWFGNRRISLYETEDASLVMTLRRGFWKVWEVYDSEDFPIGLLYRNTLLDQCGGHIAQPERRREEVIFRDSLNRELAWTTRAERGCSLAFSADVPTNPFIRLVLLAAALTQGPEPR